MKAIKKIVSREDFKNFVIPEEFGEKFEVIILPIESGKAEKMENGDYFEIEDKNGIVHKIPNWTEDECRKFGLKVFFESENTSVKELFDV